MASFSELTPDSYYLIKENENSRVDLIFILMTTENCALIEFQDDEQTTAWYKKTDFIFEIIEQLSEEHATMYESIARENDTDGEDEQDWEIDDDLHTWFGEDDDADNDEKMRALNN
jgi:hypothetical protein